MKEIGNAIGVLTQAKTAQPPIAPEYVRSLEVAVQASLPRDYHVLVSRCGAFSVPGEPVATLFDPATICAYAASIYNMEQIPPAEWPALPIARYDQFGDDLGYIRSDQAFGPEIGILHHEGPWLASSKENWYTSVADSLSEFIISRRTA